MSLAKERYMMIHIGIMASRSILWAAGVIGVMGLSASTNVQAEDLRASSNGRAVTRLGLHFTQEELDIWRKRAQSGPYKSAGDVSRNSPGDWDRIVKYKDAFMANPSADHWAGWTVDRPLTRDDTPGGSVGTSAWAHTNMLCASFYSLLMNDTAVRHAVRAELLAQAAEPGVDFANSVRWSIEYAGADQANFWGVAMWMGRLLNTYDYVRSDLSASDRAALDTWFHNAADFYRRAVNNSLSSIERFPNRAAGDYTPGSYGQTYCEKGPFILTHFGGYKTSPIMRSYNNRMVQSIYLMAAVGVMLKDGSLIADAKRYFKEHLMFGFFADGTPSEFERGIEDGAPTNGWRYSGAMIGDLVMIADVLARSGDTELYTYSTSDGLSIGPSPTTGGPKSLSLVIGHYLKYVVPSITRYGTDKPARSGNIQFRIDTKEELDGGSESVTDSYLVPANLWYKNALWKSIFLRQASGTPPYPAGPAYPGEYCWMGPCAKWPGFLFMFGQMEGKVDPYGLSSDESGASKPD